MAEMDVNIDDELLDRVGELALRHYGDDSEGSRKRVVECAIYLRLLWAELREGNDNIEEPVLNWEFGQRELMAEPLAAIRQLLFRRR